MRGRYCFPIGVMTSKNTSGLPDLKYSPRPHLLQPEDILNIFHKNLIHIIIAVLFNFHF